MKREFQGIDPLVMATALLIGAGHRRRTQTNGVAPPSRDQLERQRVIREREAWNTEVDRRKAEKSLAKEGGAIGDDLKGAEHG